MAKQREDIVLETPRPRQGIGTRVFNYIKGVLFGQPAVLRRPKDKDHPSTQGYPAYLGDEGQNMYSFYGERMRLGKTRVEIYDEVDTMDSDDLPAATLDTYAEDSTPSDPSTGRAVWVEDCSDEIRKLCDGCLERIQMEEYAYLIARSLSKYGDFPIELYWEPGLGVTQLRFHHPKRFKRFEEYETGMLVGFHIGDSAHGASEPNKQPWEIVHFRIFGSLSAMYGTSMLITSRRSYKRLRLSEDSDVVYRLQRHADRDVFNVTMTGMSDPEISEYAQRFVQALRKNKFYDPEKGELREDWNPFTANEDLMLPQIQGREIKVDRLPGSKNANDASGLDYYLARYHASARIPPAYFGYMLQGALPYDPSKKLTHQDSRYSKIPQKIQRYLMIGIHRILQLNLAFMGVDPKDPKNQFTTAMAPVSYLDELHRQQLIEIRLDIIDRLMTLGQSMNFDMQLWIRYVLKQYGKLSDDLIEKLLLPGTSNQQPGGAPSKPPAPGAPPQVPPAPGGTPPPPPVGSQAGAPTGGSAGIPETPGPEFESVPEEIRADLKGLAVKASRLRKIREDLEPDISGFLTAAQAERALRHEVLPKEPIPKKDKGENPESKTDDFSDLQSGSGSSS